MKMRRRIWLILWMVSLVGISFYGGAVSYGFFWATTLVPIVSLVYLLCVYFRFKIYQEVESRTMVCGQTMPYFFVLRNEDYFGFTSVNVRMFPHFSYVENVAEDIEYELLPGDEYTYHTTLICKYRGEYEVGVKEVIVTDFFRIFKLKYPVVGTIKAIVYPRLVEVSQLYAMPEIVALLQREAMFAKSEPDVVVRNYISGDSLKRIHWKISAKENCLKVRSDIGEERHGIKLLLDTRRYDKKMENYIPLESKMLEVFLTLGLFFARKNIRFQAYYGKGGCNCKDVVSIKGFEDFYTSMTNISFDEEDAFGEMLTALTAKKMLQEAKVLIGVVHELNNELLYLTESLAADGVMVILYVITDEDMEFYLRQSTQRRKIIMVGLEAELEGVL
ncbi:MAG: DUF58 domain-containing protein [Lachnospiraceae bacterium]|nr:DUF58 domain-containing protein [Lachnospiraceae bacterium]